MKTLEGYTKSHDGTEIYYKSEGEGFPLIVCNGILCSTGYWVYLTPFFKDRCQVVTWDYRGHGKSGLPAKEKNHTMNDFAADLLAVMNELKISKAVFAGHSMGVQLILEFYKQHPEKVMGLIPILGTYGRPFTSFYGQAWVDKIMPVFLKQAERFSGIISFVARPLINSPLSVPSARLSGAINWYLAPGDVMQKYFAQIADMDLGFAFRALRAMGNHTAEDILDKIKVPTLIIAGENDPFTPAEQSEKMHRKIKNSELLMIRKGTHTALIEQPDLMHLRIELFLRHHFQDQGYRPLVENIDAHLFQKKSEDGIISKALKLLF
ncbi:MAG: alpha/beta hydrolase [Desulfobacterales bacterium]|nr:alpha/beta hydrolase [Desulfobacterales bacterium]MBF0397731.1 alpha/beta hydrolase [Desulfobacterales bacterium]